MDNTFDAVAYINGNPGIEKAEDTRAKVKTTKKPQGKYRGTDFNIRIAKCAYCHKEFVPTVNYAYRDGSKLYCSWHCLSAAKYPKG